MTPAETKPMSEEEARVACILKTAKALGLSDAFAQKHIEAQTDIDMFRRKAIDKSMECLVCRYGDHVGVIRFKPSDDD